TQKGYPVTIATSRLTSETFRQPLITQKDGVKIKHLKSLNGLEELIRRNDIVHVQLTFSLRPAAMAAMEICQKLGKRFFVTLHTNITHIPFSALANLNPLEKEQLLNKAKTFLCSELTTIIAPSPTIKDSFTKLGIEKELKVIRPGIELERIKNFKDGMFTPCDLLTIGEVSLMKGLNYLIDALKILEKEESKIKLRIVGDGPDVSLLKRQAEVFGFSDNIEFSGYIPHDEIFGMINSGKILVQPSLTEVCPTVVLEALALKKAVVASDLSGLAEVLGFGKYGVLFKTGNAASLAEKISQLLQNKDLREELGVRGQKYVFKNFSIEKQVYSLTKVYTEFKKL
ncbi:MAG: glycosyltransferase family 4 protein, partial [Candidatus Cloacimonetes bacterium]|nr:glycosyltransferase family 4 protein [Candidatus Cloacimonadota bacterium]